MILDIFYLQVTPILPLKFQVNRPFGSGEEAKNIFSRWQPWQPSWISDYKMLGSEFQDGHHGSHLENLFFASPPEPKSQLT